MITKAAVLYESGLNPPYKDKRPLIVEDLELESPGRGEVLIKIASAGLCHSDIMVMRGVRRLPLPIVLGHECAGIVEEVGEGVTDVEKGDHVILSYVPSCGKCYYCSIGKPSLCDVGREANRRGTLISGSLRFKKNGRYFHYHLGVSAFSEYTTVSEKSLVPVRRDLPLEKAAIFGCALITGIGAAVNTAKVEVGSTVAVFGCGGVGLNVIQGAALAGAREIIAIDVVDSKLELALRLGATNSINASKEDPVEVVRKLTKGVGADYVFEAIGDPKVMAQAYKATRKAGKTIVVGITSPEETLTIPSSLLVDEERILMGSYMGSAIPRRDIPKLVDLYMSGKLKLDEIISRFIRLEEVNDGFDALARGEVARQVIKF